MKTVSDIIVRADRIARKKGWKESTVSRHVFKDGKRLKELRTGKCRMFQETIEAVWLEMDRIEDELSNRESAA